MDMSKEHREPDREPGTDDALSLKDKPHRIQVRQSKGILWANLNKNFLMRIKSL